MNIKVFIPFLFLTILFSCETEVDFNIKSQNLLVVNSILSPDSIIQVHISRSQNLSDSSETISLNNAQVCIYKDSTFIEDLDFSGDGTYKSSFTPTAKANYTIQAESEDLTSVCATTTILAKTEIDTVITLAQEFLDYSSNRCLQLTFSDDGTTNNYYFLKLEGFEINYEYDEETDEPIDSTVLFTDLRFVLNDPLISSTDNSSSSAIINSILGTYESGNNDKYWLAFSDININGTTHTIELYVLDGPHVTKATPLNIYLETIHQDYYYYLQSISNTNTFLESATSGSTSSIYSNVENGTGLFSSANIFVYPLTEIHWNVEE